MKILMTADTLGGVWTYSIELARALSKRDVEVALATMGAPLTPAQREEAVEIPSLIIYESSYKLEWMEEPWQDISSAGEWLLELERSVRPDLIHLNGYVHGALPWRAPVLVVGHSCVLSWWNAVKGEDAPSGWDRYRKEVTRGLRAADLVLTPSWTMLSDLQRYYGPLGATGAVLNGRDPAHFTSGKKEEFILAVGRLWDEAKNVATLDLIAPRLSWPVYVAGEEKHPNGKDAKMERAIPLGRLSQRELAGFYGRASIYALPARYEPFGLSALEAALSGCALILGDIHSLREIWGSAAVFVAPDDPHGLERAIEELIGDYGKRKSMATKALLLAHSLTTERMAARYLSFYRYLKGGREPQRHKVAKTN